MEAKQVIVMRKDLGMRKGKMIAQGSHASLGALLSCFNKERIELKEEDGFEPGQFINKYYCQFGDNCALDSWLNGKFTKICVSVNSEEELMEIYNKVKDTFIPHALITDAGLTEFHGIPTKTCLGIGPYTSEDLDKITGHLKLL